MPSAVYSTRLFAAAGLSVNEGYTVPAGFRAVLRDVDVFCATGASDPRIFLLGGVEGAVIWSASAPSSTFFSDSWRGRQVFNPGDIITFNPAEGAWDVTASGYLLTLP